MMKGMGRFGLLCGWLFVVCVGMGGGSLCSAEEYGLGCRLPTAEEWAEFRARSTQVSRVEPSAFSMGRAQAEAAALGVSAAPQARPSAADNSTLPYFPPIRSQGTQGSCASWAAGYYFNTYTQAMDEGYDVSGGDNSRICSPAFLYSLVNRGIDDGSSVLAPFDRLNEVGCSSWALKPYSVSDYTSWPSEAAWVEALKNRTDSLAWIEILSEGDLEAVKQLLANGGVCVGALDVHTNFDAYPAAGPGVSNDVYYAADGSFRGGHALTLVGYDDNKSYVDHRDGQTYYGAFLLANSWPDSWGVQNSSGAGTNGFCWVAYRAFVEEDTVWPAVLFNTDRPRYRPRIYAVGGVNHSQRGYVSIYAVLGVYPSWYSPDAVHLSGGTSVAVTDANRIAVDMTEGMPWIVPGEPTPVGYYLEVSGEASTAGTITSADFYVDLDGDGVFTVTSSVDPPVSVDPGSVGWAGTAFEDSLYEYEVVTSALPSALTWGETSGSSVTVRNLTSSAWAPAEDYRLQANEAMDRWGLVSVPLGSETPAGGTHAFSFAVEGPPLSTLTYPAPAEQRTPGAVDTLACAWGMYRGGTPLGGGAARSDVTVSRFPDIQPETAGAWARFYVEECAGRVPRIVGGYLDGTYRPAATVARDAMAVFMQRTLELETTPYQGKFSDVASDFWAALEIEALVDAGIVQGFPNNTYRPALIVARDAMAVYVARALVGGIVVPTGPATPTFSDVGTDHWAYNEIEHTVAQGIVQGYPNGTYRPTLPVDRGQMAVFVYRGFIAPSGAVVVLGGPAVTAVNPATAGYWGWSSVAEGPASDPGHAYVVLDAVRFGLGLVFPETPSGTLDVEFELREAAAPETAASGDYTTTVSVTVDEVAAAMAAARTSGIPYYAVSWDIPAGLTPGEYVLVVSVRDKTGVLKESARRHGFAITE